MIAFSSQDARALVEVGSAAAALWWWATRIVERHHNQQRDLNGLAAKQRDAEKELRILKLRTMIVLMRMADERHDRDAIAHTFKD